MAPPDFHGCSDGLAGRQSQSQRETERATERETEEEEGEAERQGGMEGGRWEGGREGCNGRGRESRREIDFRAASLATCSDAQERRGGR